jgi:hypothetical protein
VSPRLQIRFDLTQPVLQVFYPNGQPFLSHTEVSAQLAQTSQQLTQTSQQLEQAQERAHRLAEKLRTMGIDPDAE